MVPILIDDLFNWMNEVKDNINPLILSFIFHYEFFLFILFRMEMEGLLDYGK